MILQLGTLTSGIKMKAALVAAGIIISSTNGVSSMDMTTMPPIPSQVTQERLNILQNDELWSYLRSGLNYVEASGEDLPANFVHPGGVAYGPLAMTRIAIKDVLMHYEEMEDYDIDDILNDIELYERCGKLFADLLLGHYLKIQGSGISKEDIFDILQRAWFLGPTIFKDGGKVPESRSHNAREYIRIARAD